jgi:hypothetical protein
MKYSEALGSKLSKQLLKMIHLLTTYLIQNNNFKLTYVTLC